MADTLGVLVAGGAGSRLGLEVPKALARLGGKTLLVRAVRTLTEVCDAVAVAAPSGLVLPLLEAAGGPTLVRVFDPHGTAGPLAGVVAGLAARPFTRAIVLAVDLPFMTAGALEDMLAGLDAHQAVIPSPGGVPQPLAAAYAASAQAVLEARLHAGETSISKAIQHLDVAWLDDLAIARLSGGDENFFNLNTPADLAEAERRIAARETVR